MPVLPNPSATACVFVFCRLLRNSFCQQKIHLSCLPSSVSSGLLLTWVIDSWIVLLT